MEPSHDAREHSRACAPARRPALDIDVWRGSLDQEPEVLRRLQTLLSPDERARSRRFRFDRDRHRYVVGRGLLRVLLGRYVGANPAELRFGYSAHDKPRLLGSRLHFNVSHSHATALFAFSPHFEVGVDVELVEPDFACPAIAERFFSSRETAALQALSPAERARGFFACWTRKEAFLKARGDGLTLPLDSFDVTVAPDEPPRLLRTSWSREEPRRWQLVDLSDAANGEAAALAAPARAWRCVRHDIDRDIVFD